MHCRTGLPILAVIFIFTTPAYGLNLRDALDAAWDRQPAQRAHAARQAELNAKRKAADALAPAPASVSIGRRSDRFGNNAGQSELEIELATSLWLPGQSSRQRALVEAESDAYGAAQTLAKWRLAGEVRDAWWHARLAEAERELARQKLDSAAALAADVARRVKAGDLALVDANRARAEEQMTRIALGDAEVRAFRALQQFTALTGLVNLPLDAEQAAEKMAEKHPQRAATHEQSMLAQKRVEYVAATRRESPELSLVVTRERASFEERYGNNFALRLKIPFASDDRNQSLNAAAEAERAEADAAQTLESSRIDAGIAIARRELDQAEAAVQLSLSRFELALETQQLLARAFKLGELDLPARLRAEAERFEAERNLVRARLEAGRAISTLNQASGLLP